MFGSNRSKVILLEVNRVRTEAEDIIDQPYELFG